MTALWAHNLLEFAGHALYTLATCTIVRPSSPAVTLRALIPCIAAGNRPDVLDMRNTRGRQARLKGSTVGARGALLANAVGPRHGCFGRARESRAHCARLIPHLDLVGASAASRARLPRSAPWEYVRVESTHVWEVWPHHPNPKHVRHQQWLSRLPVFARAAQYSQSGADGAYSIQRHTLPARPYSRTAEQ